MATFNYTTNSKRILGDLFTPVSLYMRLRDLYPQSMLMESSDYHGNENAKSFIGIHPMASIQVNHGVISMLFPDGKEGRTARCRWRTLTSPSVRWQMLSTIS